MPRKNTLARWIILPTLALLSACALPRWPTEGPITSPFGVRLDGIRPEIHRGVDIGVPTGTPVHAMAAGRVLRSGWMTGYGIAVVLDHGAGVVTLYAHLSEAGVEAGETVAARQRIGLSGATGYVTGPHLHFEVHRRGRPEDPVPLLGGEPGRGG